MDSEDHLPWEWHPGERGFHFRIPPHERIPPPPSTVLQGRFAGWDSELGHGWVPDLTGCTLEEVHREAERIQLGDEFTCMKEFDRCLDSWCVLNGRRASRIKTQRNFAIRVCHFGGRVRPLWRHNENRGEQPTDAVQGSGSGHHGIPSPFRNPPSSQTYASNFRGPQPSSQSGFIPSNEWDNCTDAGDCSSVRTAHSQNSQFPLPPTGNTPRTFGTPICTAPAINTSTATQNCSSVFQQPMPSRQPLQQLDLNADFFDGHNLRSQTSFVRNTREWIPPNTEMGTGEAVTRNRSRTGACGELGRMILPVPDAQQELCPWRVRVQLDKTGKFVITVCNLRHTCPVNGHKWRGPTHKSLWLGQTLAPRVVRNVKVAVRELTDGLQMDYMKTTNYHQMWRARDMVKDWYLGGQRQSFHMIPALLSRLKDVDPDCVVDWCPHEGTCIFKRAFICPSATRAFLQYCQPMVSLDACHTKNRKYPCQLFLATVLDGSMKGAILCYAIAPVESTENWQWFLKLVEVSIHGIQNPDIPLMSDRQKGLIAAVNDVFPDHFHGNCAHHLRGNVKKNYGRAAEAFFWGAVYAHTPAQFKSILDSLERTTSSGRGAVEYINSIDPKTYARHAFPLPRLGKVTSNPVEQANSGLLPIREFAPFKLLVELWYYMQGRFNERRREAELREEFLTASAHRSHAANLRTYGQWTIHDDGYTRALLQTTDHRNAYIVDVGEKAKCTCYELQEMIWPCQHIMAWDDRDGKDFMRHFHPCWLTSSLVSMYEARMPVFLCNDLEPSAECFPPEAAVKKGRHRVVQMRAGQRSAAGRMLAEDEFEDVLGNLYLQYPVSDDPQLAEPVPTVQVLARASEQQRARAAVRTRRRRPPQAGDRRVRCGNCGVLGHNRRTCVRESGQTVDAEETLHTGNGGEEEPTFQPYFEEETREAGPSSPSARIVPNYPISDPDSESDSESELDNRTPPTYTPVGSQNAEADVLSWMTEDDLDYYISLTSQAVADHDGGLPR